MGDPRPARLSNPRRGPANPPHRVLLRPVGGHARAAQIRVKGLAALAGGQRSAAGTGSVYETLRLSLTGQGSLAQVMAFTAALESAAMQSLGGAFEVGRWKQRPYRAPHHTASAVALVGGGSNPKPGEISIAMHGILFLDEFFVIKANLCIFLILLIFNSIFN